MTGVGHDSSAAGHVHFQGEKSVATWAGLSSLRLENDLASSGFIHQTLLQPGVCQALS